jgi:RimJ/RimL family protein N-acetyltransferase
VTVDGPTTIPMQGRYTRLVPFSREFTEELFQLAAANLIPWQWHAPETPDAFQESLWRGVLVQYAIQDLRTGRSVGFLRADNANLFFGFAYMTFMLHPDYRMKAWPLEGVLLFANYLFAKFNLENLYGETTETYMKQFASGIGTNFEVEGRLRNRVVINGRREDLYILTLSRARWLAEGKPVLDRTLERLRMRTVS